MRRRTSRRPAQAGARAFCRVYAGTAKRRPGPPGSPHRPFDVTGGARHAGLLLPRRVAGFAGALLLRENVVPPTMGELGLPTLPCNPRGLVLHPSAVVLNPSSE